jgi:hypothetical protein
MESKALSGADNGFLYGKYRPLCLYRLNCRLGDQDVHDTLQDVDKHMHTHPGAHPIQRPGQEVR